VSKSQEQCFDGLKAAYKSSAFDRLRVWMSFDSGLVEDVGSEDTRAAARSYSSPWASLPAPRSAATSCSRFRKTA